MSYNLCISVNVLENGLKTCVKKFNQKKFHIHFIKNYKVEGAIE